MITLFYGPKGSGKTKRIIDSANAALRDLKGTIIYITDNAKHSKELNYNIRYIDVNDYKITGTDCTMGFIKGVLASDNDIEKVYIDGFARICGTEAGKMSAEYAELEKLCASDKVDFYITVSCDELPGFMKKYV